VRSRLQTRSYNSHHRDTPIRQGTLFHSCYLVTGISPCYLRLCSKHSISSTHFGRTRSERGHRHHETKKILVPRCARCRGKVQDISRPDSLRHPLAQNRRDPNSDGGNGKTKKAFLDRRARAGGQGIRKFFKECTVLTMRPHIEIRSFPNRETFVSVENC